MNYKDLSGKLVRKCLRAGADEAEVYIETVRRFSVRIIKNEIETIQEAASAGVGIRVICNARPGFSHSNDFSTRALDDTITKAIAYAKLTTPGEYNVFSDSQAMAQVEGLYDPSIGEIPVETKITMARELESIALRDPRVSKSSGAGFGESESEVIIAGSPGFVKSFRSTTCSLNVSVVAEKGDQKNTGSESCSRRFFSDLLPLNEIVTVATREAYELIDPRMVKTQRASVIIHPDVAGSLLGGVIQALNGERVNQGASFLGDMLHRQFASDMLTIFDDGTIERGIASRPFDGEGVPTSANILIEKGIPRTFLYNCSSAKRAGTVSTGNAVRSSYAMLPGIGTHNVYLEPGSFSRNEIIAATDRGLFIKGLTGYGIDPVTGNFSGGVTGLWIEKGEIVYPVKGLTVAGNATDILKGIDMMGNDIDRNRVFASPTFRINEMQIGGK